MQVMKSAIVDYNIPYGVIVRQDTVLDDGLNKALYMMEEAR